MAMYLVYIHYNLAEIEGFKYIGTYEDYGDRILGTTNMNKVPRVTNAEECNKIARKNGHPYFGLEWNECHTGLLTKNSNGYSPLKNTDPNGTLLSPDKKTTRNWVNDRTNTKLTGTNRIQASLPNSSATGSSSEKAGGGWSMSLYETDNTVIFNSSTNPYATNNMNLNITPNVEYFGTLKEGLIDVSQLKNQPLPTDITNDMTIEQINTTLGFTVDDYAGFIHFLYNTIGLPVKTIQQNAAPSNTSNTNTYGFLKNTDSYSNDLSQPYGSVDDCKRMCDADPKCGGFGYDRIKNANRCFLKNLNMYPNGGKGAPKKPLQDFDTYWKDYKSLPNTDSISNDIIGKQFPGTLETCKTACYNDPNCGGFGFDRRSNRTGCFIKNLNMYPKGQKQPLPNFDIYWNPNRIAEPPKPPPPQVIMFEAYPQFIYYLIHTLGITSDKKLYQTHNVNGFTTIEGATTITGVDNHIVNSSNYHNIQLSNSSFPTLIQNNTNMSQINNSLRTLQSFGVHYLDNWHTFKKQLANIGDISGQPDRAIIGSLKAFGYSSFDKIEVANFADRYTNFGFKPTSPIIGTAGYFQYLVNIKVYQSNFTSFVGESGLQQFNTSNYTVNASTFFDNSDITSSNPGLYWLMTSIGFYYDSTTFNTLVEQVKKMGILSTITTASTQSDLQNYVLTLTWTPTDDVIQKFKIFVETLKSINIKTFRQYVDFLNTLETLNVPISNLQIFIVQFRYYYIFLSKGMDNPYVQIGQSQVSDFVDKTVQIPYSNIILFLTDICNLTNFNVNKSDDFSNFMHKAIQYGWDYTTLATDSPIGNSYTDMVRQGFTSITEMFSSIAESFMGRDPFTTLEVPNEQTELQSFGVIPMNEYNTQMLGLFGQYSITQWSDIMQYVLRFNKLMIPFNGDPKIPNPKNNPSDAKYNASTTLALFQEFGITSGNDGLDLFDHLLNVVNVPTSAEMFRFINTLILFKVTYSTYYAFYAWFDSDHLNLVYKTDGTNFETNYEIFYMFLGDLMALSNAAVPFNYAEGKTNFETLVKNMQLDVFVIYTDTNGTPQTPQIHRGSDIKLNSYPDLHRQLFFINYSYDKLISSTYNCHTSICNNLVDWVTPHTPGDATSTNQNTLHPYIGLDYKPNTQVGPDGNPTPDPMLTWYSPGIKNVFSYLVNPVKLDKTVPLNDSSQPAVQLTDKHPRFNLAFCIEALTGQEANTMITCQYNITKEYKIQLINKMILNMIQNNIDTNNPPDESQRSQQLVPVYNQNVETINFLILYPLLAFEIIAGAISNPCGSATGCPNYEDKNYEMLWDPKLDYTYTNSNAMSKNYNVGGTNGTMRASVFGPTTFPTTTV